MRDSSMPQHVSTSQNKKVLVTMHENNRWETNKIRTGANLN